MQKLKLMDKLVKYAYQTWIAPTSYVRKAEVIAFYNAVKDYALDPSAANKLVLRDMNDSISVHRERGTLYPPELTILRMLKIIALKIRDNESEFDDLKEIFSFIVIFHKQMGGSKTPKQIKEDVMELAGEVLGA